MYIPTVKNNHTIQNTAEVVQSENVAGVIPAIIPDSIIMKVKLIIIGKNKRTIRRNNFFIKYWFLII
jgi:hypothetical protein